MTSAKNSSQPTNACKKIVFFGSSEFSLGALELLLSLSLDSLAVVTTPDRPKGRGLQVQTNPVREKCFQRRIPAFIPETLRDAELEGKIASLKPDLFIVSSYGKLIPSSWLKIPGKASLNIHPSLLPKYRGAAPIAWQILNGETETGVSIAEVTKDLDAGDIFCQIKIPLEEKETSGSLTKKLSELSKKALKETLTHVEGGTLRRTPQNHANTSYARKLNKEDGLLHFSESALTFTRKVRAFHPWPGVLVPYKGGTLRIIDATYDSPAKNDKAKPGTLLEINSEGALRIQTSEGSLAILKVQMPGRRLVSGKDFANGERLKPGFVFED